MSQPILQTRVSVNTSDLGEAQAKVLKLGNEALASGKKFKDASKGTETFGSKVGNLSESLDKKLEASLGKAFKGTDRLLAVFGAATGAAGLLVGGIGLLVLGYKALTDKGTETEQSIARINTGLLNQAEAADLARLAIERMGAKRTKSTADALAEARIEQKMNALKESEKEQLIAILEDEARQKKLNNSLDDITFKGFEKLTGIEALARKGMVKTTARLKARNTILRLTQTAISDLNDELVKLEEKSAAPGKAVEAFQKRLSDILLKGVKSINAFAAANKKRIDAEKKPKGKKGPSAADIAATQEAERLAANLAMAKFAAEDIRSLQALEEISGPIRQQMLIDANTRIGEEAAASALALERVREVSQGIQDEFAANAAATKEWTDALDQQISVIDQTAEASLNAGISAALYGGSVKDAINDVLEALAIESGVQALMEFARGLSDLAFGLPTASIHFKSALAFGAVGVAAGIATTATGGFNGPAGEEADSEREVASPAGDTGPSGAPTGPVSTILNINLTAGSRPLTRIDARMFVDELNEIQQVAS